jgi:hypothetical protein
MIAGTRVTLGAGIGFLLAVSATPPKGTVSKSATNDRGDGHAK